ncbi:pwwp domain-containing protein 2a [Plakobranchus ocellatus]|uniref:Pwwp domain-containing protein 2a n=1 Tax=Plakobranchus ocellatus TaxID=259542 RepID=A0AAV4DL23_9GAST|nr:pwwp domain-containing protein 2a [Plakobranchus ocellatus]
MRICLTTLNLPTRRSGKTMANLNIENETLAKGVRLTVIVEYSFENIIAVFLFHNGKEFRGVLLENDPGLFPHGIPFSNKPMVEQNASLKTSPRSALDVKPGTENKPPDLSYSKDTKVEPPATCGRFSYNVNPFLVNPRPVPDIPTVEMKPVVALRKTVRDIRLRPRQTLCSKCKSAIHESLKGHHPPTVNMHQAFSKETTETLPPNKKCLKTNSNLASPSPSLPNDAQRKRKNANQTPMVVLEDIKLKYMKPLDKKSSKVSSAKHARCEQNLNKTAAKSHNKEAQKLDLKLLNTKVRGVRSSVGSGSVNSLSHANVQQGSLKEIDVVSETNLSGSGKNLKKDKATSNEGNSKPSPAIKISIGDGAILKIPPRLPEKEAQCNDQQVWTHTINSSNSSNISVNQMQHKKSKKAAKRSKEKDKCKTSAFFENSGTPITDAAEAFALKVQKKHKKKHRHKHDEPNQNVTNIERSGLEENVTFQKGQVCDKSQEPLPVQPDTDDLGGTTLDDSIADNKPAVEQPRPRLLYTWKQNQGLSRVPSSPKQSSSELSPPYMFKNSPILPLRVSNSPHRRKNASPARVISASPNWHIGSSQNVILKDYPLRSKSHSSSGLSSENLAVSENGVNQVSDDSQSHSSGVDSNISDFCDGDFIDEITSEDEFFFREGSPSLEKDERAEDDGSIKPLMMKIQTQNVTGCVLKEGREVRVGDIVWGKIAGFPWWPGRISSITVTQRDNDVVITQLAKVCWFGSNTMSHVRCSDLYPFLQEFKARYNKKKKGQYRVAIKQATVAAQMLTDAREDDFSFEGYE